jgi:hypothetical protein
MLPPARRTIALAVCFLSSWTVTLSGLPGVTKSIAGALLAFLEVDRLSNLHDRETARSSRRTDKTSFMFAILAILSIHFSSN